MFPRMAASARSIPRLTGRWWAAKCSNSSGWCLFEGSHVAQIDVLVDGETSCRARPYIERPDVALLLSHPDAPVAGFQAAIELERRDAGTEVRLAVRALSVDGRRWRSGTYRLQWTDEIVPVVRGIEGNLDAPRDGELLDGEVLNIRGWCLFDSSRVAHIEIVVDGKRAGLAQAVRRAPGRCRALRPS